MPDDLVLQLGNIRKLTQQAQAGGPDTFEAFRELTSLLLQHTVMRPGEAVRLYFGSGRREKALLGGFRSMGEPIQLNNGAFLRMSLSLYLDQTIPERYLKVEESGYQYQADRDGERWIFRYDYLRNPPGHHPAAHLQIRGGLEENVLPEGVPLERVHLPTGRVSLEAVIRLLADQFQVPCNSPAEFWRALLLESEKAFIEVAHHPPSGPAE